MPKLSFLAFLLGCSVLQIVPTPLGRAGSFIIEPGTNTADGLEPSAFEPVRRLAAPGSASGHPGTGIGAILFPPAREEVAGQAAGEPTRLWFWDMKSGKKLRTVSLGISFRSLLVYSSSGGMLAGEREKRDRSDIDKVGRSPASRLGDATQRRGLLLGEWFFTS